MIRALKGPDKDLVINAINTNLMKPFLMTRALFNLGAFRVEVQENGKIDNSDSNECMDCSKHLSMFSTRIISNCKRHKSHFQCV